MECDAYSDSESVGSQYSTLSYQGLCENSRQPTLSPKVYAELHKTNERTPDGIPVTVEYGMDDDDTIPKYFNVESRERGNRRANRICQPVAGNRGLPWSEATDASSPEEAPNEIKDNMFNEESCKLSTCRLDGKKNKVIEAGSSKREDTRPIPAPRQTVLKISQSMLQNRMQAESDGAPVVIKEISMSEGEPITENKLKLIQEEREPTSNCNETFNGAERQTRPSPLEDNYRQVTKGEISEDRKKSISINEELTEINRHKHLTRRHAIGIADQLICPPELNNENMRTSKERSSARLREEHARNNKQRKNIEDTQTTWSELLQPNNKTNNNLPVRNNFKERQIYRNFQQINYQKLGQINTVKVPSGIRLRDVPPVVDKAYINICRSPDTPFERQLKMNKDPPSLRSSQKPPSPKLQERAFKPVPFPEMEPRISADANSYRFGENAPILNEVVVTRPEMLHNMDEPPKLPPRANTFAFSIIPPEIPPRVKDRRRFPERQPRKFEKLTALQERTERSLQTDAEVDVAPRIPERRSAVRNDETVNEPPIKAAYKPNSVNQLIPSNVADAIVKESGFGNDDHFVKNRQSVRMGILSTSPENVPCKRPTLSPGFIGDNHCNSNHKMLSTSRSVNDDYQHCTSNHKALCMSKSANDDDRIHQMLLSLCIIMKEASQLKGDLEACLSKPDRPPSKEPGKFLLSIMFMYGNVSGK